ncbi:hypothetical protein ACFVXC_11960 [Streptomyces sp. NPDC058257]|uniref:hypothetical protein n=1 Tax=Streptomyces sp. NPDC058257 TaxID=3346409 RepID=UPI0036EDA612
MAEAVRQCVVGAGGVLHAGAIADVPRHHGARLVARWRGDLVAAPLAPPRKRSVDR